MKPPNWFPVDLVALLSLPITTLAVMLLTQPLVSAMHWLCHPTPAAWLWALGVAASVALAGTVLLFVAKLPQYRAGIFLHVGSQHLPPRHQRLYRVAFGLLVPSLILLIALLSAVCRFQ